MIKPEGKPRETQKNKEGKAESRLLHLASEIRCCEVLGLGGRSFRKRRKWGAWFLWEKIQLWCFGKKNSLCSFSGDWLYLEPCYFKPLVWIIWVCFFLQKHSLKVTHKRLNFRSDLFFQSSSSKSKSYSPRWASTGSTWQRDYTEDSQKGLPNKNIYGTRVPPF